MRSNRAVASIASAAIAAVLLAGCSAEEEVRLAEPELDFPYTSTTAKPTPASTSATATTETSTTSETSTSTSSSKSSSSSSSKSSTSTKTSTSTKAPSGGARVEEDVEPAPAPAPAPVEQPQAAPEPGAACAWPTQSEANNREFSTFCDREWARTVVPSSDQQYFWQAKGNGWSTIDPAAIDEDGICWDPADFEGAPEAIRKAAVFCEPERLP